MYFIELGSIQCTSLKSDSYFRCLSEIPETPDIEWTTFQRWMLDLMKKLNNYKQYHSPMQ